MLVARLFSRNLLFGVLLLGILVCAVGTTIILLEKRQAKQSIVRATFQSSAQEVARNTALFIKVYNLHNLQRILSGSFLARNSEFVTISNVKGEEIFVHPQGELGARRTCAKSLVPEPVFLNDESVGTIRYCVDFDRYAKFDVPVGLIAFLYGAILVMGVVFFLWINAQAKSLTQFMEMIESLEPENPRIPQAFGQQDRNPTVRALYEKMRLFLERLERTKAELQMKEQEALYVDISRQVAHDIRSPLTALRMAVEDIAPGISEGHRAMLRGGIARITGIANELIRKTQEHESESTSPWREPVSIARVAGEIFSEKRLQYREREIRFAFDGEHVAECVVNADETELRRIFSNLIDNSVQAIEGLGEVAGSMESAGDQVRFRLRDNGRGIPARVLPRLMQKNASFGKRGGSGLGLYRAAQSMAAWGGEIELSSVEGQGTEVTLKFPGTVP